MKRIYLLFNIALFLFPIVSQDIFIPAYTGEILTRENYTLKYNEKFEQAEWVAYELTRDEVLGSTKRKDTFKPDPDIITGSATLEDYRGSGYDKGHLAPAADMKMSSDSMSDSFYMSNMSPQAPSFNRGIWSKLESYVRTWAYENESIYVVTGPVLNKTIYPTIGENEVAVPEYYYKIILDLYGDEVKAIGFILPNEKISDSLLNYVVTIDEVEKLTRIDFFPLLDDNLEQGLESASNPHLWTFKTFSSTDKVKVKQEEIGTVFDVQFWINSNSMTRHNSSCKYYNNTKNGYFTSEEEGSPCSSCGG